MNKEENPIMPRSNSFIKNESPSKHVKLKAQIEKERTKNDIISKISGLTKSIAPKLGKVYRGISPIKNKK